MRNYLGPCVENHIAKWEHYRGELLLHMNDGQFKVNAASHSAPDEKDNRFAAAETKSPLYYLYIKFGQVSSTF